MMHAKMSPEQDKLILVLTTMIQNEIGREDEHLQILSIFAPDDRKNHRGLFFPVYLN